MIYVECIRDQSERNKVYEKYVKMGENLKNLSEIFQKRNIKQKKKNIKVSLEYTSISLNIFGKSNPLSRIITYLNIYVSQKFKWIDNNVFNH
jgi:hypothetical protein